MTLHWHGFDGKEEALNVTHVFVAWAEMQPIVTCTDAQGCERTFGLDEGIFAIDDDKEDK